MYWTIHLEGAYMNVFEPQLLVLETGGPRRVNHCAVSLNGKIYSFGGYCSGEDYDLRKPMDVHVLDTATYRWKSLPTPNIGDSEVYEETPYQRYGHSAVEYKGRAYIWGGRNDADGASDVLHEYNPATHRWRSVICAGTIPPSRDGHSACVTHNLMIVFGGFEETFQRFSRETYVLDLDTMQWTELHTFGLAPSWRDFHSATVIENRMYVFGGRSDEMGQFHSNREVYHPKLYFLDLVKHTWNSPEVFGDEPSGRRSHSAWFYKNKLYLFGGYNGNTNQHFNQLYQFDPVTNVWRLLNPGGLGPDPRRRQCCVLEKEKVFLFGGTKPVDNVNSVMGELPLTESSNNLLDLSDMFVLDYEPSLKTLASLAVIKNLTHNLTHQHNSILPWDLRMELISMVKPNRISNSRAANG